jgi:AraC family transcriptional activator of pobA
VIDITAFENAPHLLNPRRIRKYVLIWCSSGMATLVVAENEFGRRKNKPCFGWLNRLPSYQRKE